MPTGSAPDPCSVPDPGGAPDPGQMRYIEDDIPFHPTHHGEPYKELIRLTEKFSRTRTSSHKSKKWWDDEVARH